jgi:hypothetical protein
VSEITISRSSGMHASPSDITKLLSMLTVELKIAEPPAEAVITTVDPRGPSSTQVSLEEGRVPAPQGSPVYRKVNSVGQSGEQSHTGLRMVSGISSQSIPVDTSVHVKLKSIAHCGRMSNSILTSSSHSSPFGGLASTMPEIQTVCVVQ